MRAPTQANEASPDLVPGPVPLSANDPAVGKPSRQLPRTAAVAARLVVACEVAEEPTAIFLAEDERRADEIGRAARAFSPALEVLILPPWDCLPYDRTSPTRGCMGRRIAVLQRLATSPTGNRLLVTSPDAMMQKVGAIDEVLRLERGTTLEREALEQFAKRTGYVLDDQVDEPGDIAFQGSVIDVFPSDAAAPVRVLLDAVGTIEDLRTFDAATQRSDASIERVSIVPASELLLDDELSREPGLEHHLPAFRSDLRAIFDLIPGAALFCDADALRACERFAARVVEAYETRRSFAGPADRTPPQPTHLYLTRSDLDAASNAREIRKLALGTVAPLPVFSLEKDAVKAAVAFVKTAVKDGGRVAIAGIESERALLARALKRLKLQPRLVDTWADALAAETGSVLALNVDLELGFIDRDNEIAVMTGSDVFGARIAAGGNNAGGLVEARAAPEPGDVVVHEDHGVAVLRGLERVEIDGSAHEVVRLDFHGDAKLLVPTDEFDRIWRYGSEPDAVTLDRLHTDGWNKRRVKINAYVEDAAARLVQLAAARAEAKTPPLAPPADALAQFAARFPFPETADQSAAISAVLDDLASGTPMNRLVCGDVGYGKTEVALRAAAAVALCGKQVALVAPTTVLVRQHVQTFRRRFAGTDVEIVHLSRLVSTREAKEARKSLANGKASIVIGTQMVSSEDAEFEDLALVILDEEHRFGAKVKDALKALAPHHLALSATPIPRTLQGALVGVQDVSVLAAPPARRRPVRTFLSPFDKAGAQLALLREKRRGGQSFVVVPRIEDIQSITTLLAEIAPSLSTEVVHGDLPAEEVDEAMVRFADGERDVLVATSLIENGLDVPRANTMLVWGADRFGLAQLHQLRGRVGRGRVQGTTYLFIPADDEIAKSTADRLAALVAADRLGAGFEISARDLDLRGGGDLVGEEQAGHMRLIGAALYQHLLERAVRAQTGKMVADRRAPSLQIEGTTAIPATYVADQALRLELYARLAHLDEPENVDAFRDEMEDRFGPLPPDTERLLTRGRLAILARHAGVSTLVIGPKAAALTFLPDAAARAQACMDVGHWKERRLIIDGANDAGALLASVTATLARLTAEASVPGAG